MAGFSITFTSDSTRNELDAVMAMILTLTETADPVMPEIAAIKEAPLARPTSSPESGTVLPVGISATVPAVPAPANIPLPPVASAPVAAVPLPPVLNGAAPALDGEGLPWDARIHSASKDHTVKGVWRRRKNTPDTVWDAVRAELKQALGAPTPPTLGASTLPPLGAPTPPPVAAPLPPVTPAPVSEAEAAFAGNAPAPTVSVPVAATTAANGDAFVALLTRVTAAQTAGQFTPVESAAVCVSLGLTGIRDLLHRPDLIPSVEAALFS